MLISLMIFFPSLDNLENLSNDLIIFSTSFVLNTLSQQFYSILNIALVGRVVRFDLQYSAPVSSSVLRPTNWKLLLKSRHVIRQCNILYTPFCQLARKRISVNDTLHHEKNSFKQAC